MMEKGKKILIKIVKMTKNGEEKHRKNEMKKD